jgi:hypothetical protein
MVPTRSAISSQLAGMSAVWGIGKPERAAEDRGDGEPVGEPAHDARLGDGEDPATPPGGAEREGRDGDEDGRHEDDHGEPALAWDSRAHCVVPHYQLHNQA